jgi:hypothetical protein
MTSVHGGAADGGRYCSSSISDYWSPLWDSHRYGSFNNYYEVLLMVDVIVRFEDRPERVIKNVSLKFEQVHDAKWIDLVNKNGEIITLNFRTYSLREIVPDKVKTRKSDGVVLDDGSRVTCNFESVEIIRPPKKPIDPRRCC